MIVIKRVIDLESALQKWSAVINGFVFNTCRGLYLLTIHGGMFVYDIVYVKVPTSDAFRHEVILVRDRQFDLVFVHALKLLRIGFEVHPVGLASCHL